MEVRRRSRFKHYKEMVMAGSFVLRDPDRGYNKLLSTGTNSAYVAGRSDPFITRRSSFKFQEY
jgi:hypothetical protein